MNDAARAAFSYDQAIGNLRRSGYGRCVLGAAEHQVAMNLIGHENQIALGAKIGECCKLIT